MCYRSAYSYFLLSIGLGSEMCRLRTHPFAVADPHNFLDPSTDSESKIAYYCGRGRGRGSVVRIRGLVRTHNFWIGTSLPARLHEAVLLTDCVTDLK